MRRGGSGVDVRQHDLMTLMVGVPTRGATIFDVSHVAGVDAIPIPAGETAAIEPDEAE